MLAALALAAMSCMPLPTCTVPVTVSPCATPTPTVQWNGVSDVDLAKHRLYFRDTGMGGWSWLADIPCSWGDLDENGIMDTFTCPGVHLSIPLQRYCSACAPYQSYEFVVKAVDEAGNESVDYSNVVEVCFSPICVFPGPCS